MCLSVQGQFGWSSGLVEGVPVHGRGWNDRSFRVPSNQASLWFHGKCLFSQLGKYSEKTESCEEEKQNLLRFLEFSAQQSSGKTVRNFHFSVNYSRNSFVRETQRTGCAISVLIYPAFFCHYFLCFQLTLIPRKGNKLQTTLYLVLQWKSDLQGECNDNFKQHRKFLFRFQMQLHI